ncbi:hypothetical protein U0039_09370 [Stenotrophomonas maltophilia]|uniref:hypothetical protein n=1 Tax=Stenotrophomonas TaxID=40323 RepID=UPI0004694349|nr:MULTISPECIES: hypothetical protein [Stenotrophomonas]OMP39615.1 hypothetical protein BMR86_11680 [Stenotrophomonas sp. KAs 5-3]AIL10308.1 hypothetical protein DP16_1820 [Stenotrophomonas maltophilia]AWT14223.1 hypothetical protein DM611_07985 [Stenotrophomonas maltophilia]EKU9962747.1 hypothetical protein [Stenotrophomonas maltophilia]MBH1412631.1 hypothetical protein [Stenotrophomonas maltophilia]
MAKEGQNRSSSNKTSAKKQTKKPAEATGSESPANAAQTRKAWAKKVLEKAIIDVVGGLLATGAVAGGGWLIDHISKVINGGGLFWGEATTPKSAIKAAATQDRLIYLQQLYLDIAVLLATHQKQLSKHASRLPELEQQLSANLDISVKVRSPGESERLNHKVLAALIFDRWVEGLKPMAPSRLRRM